MPSISHRSDPGQGVLQRAKSGLAALPAGIVRGIVAWFDDWRQLRHLAEPDDRPLRATSRISSHKGALIWPTIF